jgi:hypothetical protein
MKTIIAILVISICAMTAPLIEHDYIDVETPVRLTWHDDELGRMDTVVIALSIKQIDGNHWRVLPKTGPVIICNEWKPTR